MTSIGHSIVGASLGVAALPVGASRRFRSIGMSLFVLLANFPDIPLPYWSHQQYDFSHSLLVNLGLIAVLALALRLVARATGNPQWTRLTAALACAWLSHILLDTFYRHAHGVAVFWPVSTARLAAPIPWFWTLPMQPAQHPGRIIAIVALETLSYAPLLTLALRLRRRKLRRLWAAPGQAPSPVAVPHSERY